MVNKKIIAVVITSIIILSAAGFYFGRFLRQGQSSLLEAQLPSPTVTPVDLTLWQDQSEFSFQYPANLKFNSHPEDDQNYAHLELTAEDHPGKIILWTKDTEASTLDDYIKESQPENYLGSQIGGLPAVKVLKEDGSGKFVISTIREGYLYQIEVETEGDSFWNDVLNTILSSYQFKQAELEGTEGKASPQNQINSSGQNFDDAELIE